ncbi:MAG: FtsX-like permease family protein [Roseivirga sp.]|nr:FtsX-like permease family protein [Roseivirga sp.]
MSNQPPKILRWLFNLLAPSERKVDMEGDFTEVYQDNLDSMGKWKANWSYLLNVITLFSFGHYLRYVKISNSLVMLKSIVKTRFRAIVKFRIGAMISLLTLSLGAVACGFLAFYIHYELSYDEFHTDYRQIYRVNSTSGNANGELTERAYIPLPAGPKITSEFDEVSEFARLQRIAPSVSYNNKVFEEQQFFLTDNTFFDIFSFPIVKGNTVSPLVSPQTVVLTESMVVKYFGSSDPIGKVIDIKVRKSYSLNFTTKSFTVTGVVSDPPENSHLQFDFLASISTLGDFKKDDWLGGIATYIKVKADHDVDLINQKFNPLIRENLGPYLQGRFNMSFDQYLESGRSVSFSIQPITEIHTAAGLDGEFEEGVNKSFLQILISVAALIFILTTVNFFNISFANGLHRVKEIGVRKSMGAFKNQVFSLFLMESAVLGGFSILMAALLVLIVKPFVPLFQVELPSGFELSFNFILAVVLSTVLICLFSGIFIATALSAVSPKEGLRGSLLKGHRGVNLQKWLLGLQFLVAFITLMAAAVFQSQNNYLLEADLGFDEDQVIVVHQIEKVQANDRQVLLNEWSKLPEAKSLSLSYHLPGGDFETLEFAATGSEQLLWPVLVADDYFLDTYAIALLTNGSSSEVVLLDSSDVMINESAMREMGYLEASEVLEQKLVFYGKKLTIKGVISDFHHENLYNQIGPLVLLPPGALPEPALNPYKYASVRLTEIDPGTIEQIEKGWYKVNPTTPFTFSYLKDDLSASYLAEQRLAAMIKGATIVAILIAILGLTSMSQVIFRIKVKEIAMRKVLGASALKLYELFIRQFFWPLSIALLLALPFVVSFSNEWLNKFAYRISMGWQVFTFSGLGLILLALAILTINALRAARQNPVKYIKVDH